MAGLDRVVVPGLPHHVTQRGIRRQQTFFNDGDYARYLELLGRFAAQTCPAVRAYCLMPNPADWSRSNSRPANTVGAG